MVITRTAVITRIAVICTVAGMASGEMIGHLQKGKSMNTMVNMMGVKDMAGVHGGGNDGDGHDGDS